nr:chemotaxis response regulator protein-glutamate methylesterase [Roseospira visakhapatnamensis]
MVVDDSAVVRGLETRMLQSDPDITVVASVSNGQLAVQALDKHDIEVVILDIEMPVLDGLSALPKLLARDPDLKIIMASTLTLRNAEISLQALQAGATEYLPKPSASRDITGDSPFKRELVSKVKALGQARRRGVRRPGPATTAARSRDSLATRTAAAAAAIPARPAVPITLRRPAVTPEPVDIIAIGSSTGGPQALFAVLSSIAKLGGVSQPMLITQHMPATFTTILAGHISRIATMEAREAENGEVVRNNRIYVAPGDYHMLVESKGVDKVLRLTQDPPENFCRPAVDPMFRSVARAYGRRVLGVVLTGMGSDGAKGSGDVVKAGGTVIAQDEATSVVWGMPGATAQAGVCTAILPVNDIGPWIYKMASKR